ncbi:Heat shock 70 kDa protein cognate 4 [Diplonema papillatum]|nr:Heat shock 70 kDa protein cognate 4 [Diplonema papillatum]WGM49989.1 HSPA-4 [Diplonema papillatum]
MAQDGDREPVIGIDLGTTNSVVGVWDWASQTVKIVPTDEGERSVPSVVCFYKGDVLIGEAAKRKLTTQPTNSIYNSKRVIGRPFSKVRQLDVERWTFRVVSTGDSRPRYEVVIDDEEKLVSPEEIGALILAHLRRMAEKFIGKEVTKVVITVPAYFTEPQRRATRDAGVLAGLDVLRILPEPTAAAIAFGLDRKVLEPGREEGYVLVFDMGGGTFDVSLLRMDGKGSFCSEAVTGDFHLGGEDFDDLVLQWVIENAPGLTAADITPKIRQRLRRVCEEAKRELSSSTETVIDIEIAGKDIELELTRATFERLCAPLFANAMGEVQKALDLAHVTSEEVDHIVLVGGSTRIPTLQENLQRFFNGKRLSFGVNPDEAVAWGATALAAATVAGRKQTVGETFPMPMASSAGNSICLKDVHLASVTPITLGIGLTDGTMDVLIPRGTKIPTSRSAVYSTTFDGQKAVVVRIYEGENTERAEANHLLGKFMMPIPDPAPASVPQVRVTFEITADGLFMVTATDIKSRKEIKVKLENSNLSAEEKSQIVAAVGTERAHLRALISQSYGVASQAEDKALIALCTQTLEWLHSYPEASKTEMRSRHQQLTEALAVCQRNVSAF